jgi:hypothetical protein
VTDLEALKYFDDWEPAAAFRYLEQRQPDLAFWYYSRRDPRAAFYRLTDLEPALLRVKADVEHAATRSRSARHFCMNAAWNRFHRRLQMLVGPLSRHPSTLVRASGAVDTCFRALHDLLPECRGGSCQCTPLPGGEM